MAFADEGEDRIQGDSVERGHPVHFCIPCQHLLGPCEDGEGSVRGDDTFRDEEAGSHP